VNQEADNSPTIAQIRDLEAKLATAVKLLREFGACDQYTGQPYDEVHEFLRSLGVDPRA
jgi:hypothetical protein